MSPVPPETAVGHVHLKVADLERSIEFYSTVLGFQVTQRLGSGAAFLSAGGYHHHIGLNTWESEGGSPPPRQTTGLYHVALRYPGRQALGRALRRLRRHSVPLEGAADHGVSEAVYLRDPDGIGIELYRDRPRDEWPRDPDGNLRMYTRPLDLEDLLREGGGDRAEDHPPEEVRTPRLLLRRPSQNDAEEVFEAWTRDPEVTRFLVWPPHESVEETRAFLGQCESRWERGREYVWVFEEEGTGQLVGSLSANPGSHGVELGYLVARPAWGKGYMTEVLETVAPMWLSRDGVYRVWATCDVENRASARVLEKAGFRLEGTLLRWDVHPNIGPEPRDSLCFSRVRD